MTISDAELHALMLKALKKVDAARAPARPHAKVCVLPPDFTRFHGKAGVLANTAYLHYGDAVKDVMPALGTHAPMTSKQIKTMFPDVPEALFRVHDWRNDVVTIGTVPREMVRAASGGRCDEPWPAQVNKLVWEGGHDLVLSVGQVVPHEVLGMANYNKNLFVGVGGADAINFSHFIGAVYGMERMMGRADNPLRRVLNYASDRLAQKLPLVYALTVVRRDEATGRLATCGLFVGDDVECFEKAAALSLEVNFKLLEAPLTKVVVHLDEEEYRSTWLGNKAVYRTRMAIADGGELVIVAPGVETFGEDAKIDELIRKFGYRTTPQVLKHLEESKPLMRNLSAAAHLIHGSSEGRFKVTWCPGHLSREEVEGVGYRYAPCDEMLRRYDPSTMTDGWNDMPGGERVFYVSNPATGLWAFRGRFEASGSGAETSEGGKDEASGPTAAGAREIRNSPRASGEKRRLEPEEGGRSGTKRAK
jgi:nickel-dependent lactate racemase